MTRLPASSPTEGSRISGIYSSDEPLASTRWLIACNDVAWADGMANALRAHGATVHLLDAAGTGVERLSLEEVGVLLLGAPASPALRQALQGYLGLRWATPVVVRPSRVWPAHSPEPAVHELVREAGAALTLERALSDWARGTEPRLRVNYGALGPVRLLRALADAPSGLLKVNLSTPEAVAQIRLADGLVVGVRYKLRASDTVCCDFGAAFRYVLNLDSAECEVKRGEGLEVAAADEPVPLHDALKDALRWFERERELALADEPTRRVEPPTEPALESEPDEMSIETLVTSRPELVTRRIEPPAEPALESESDEMAVDTLVTSRPQWTTRRWQTPALPTPDSGPGEASVGTRVPHRPTLVRPLPPPPQAPYLHSVVDLARRPPARAVHLPPRRPQRLALPQSLTPAPTAMWSYESNPPAPAAPTQSLAPAPSATWSFESNPPTPAAPPQSLAPSPALAGQVTSSPGFDEAAAAIEIPEDLFQVPWKSRARKRWIQVGGALAFAGVALGLFSLLPDASEPSRLTGPEMLPEGGESPSAPTLTAPVAVVEALPATTSAELPTQNPFDAIPAAERSTPVEADEPPGAQPARWREVAGSTQEQTHDQRVRSLFEQALELDPQNSRALAGLAQVLLDAGELEPARRLAERAAHLREGRYAPRMLLGRIASEQGDWPAAAAAYAEALESRPNSKAAQEGLRRAQSHGSKAAPGFRWGR